MQKVASLQSTHSYSYFAEGIFYVGQGSGWNLFTQKERLFRKTRFARARERVAFRRRESDTKGWCSDEL